MGGFGVEEANQFVIGPTLRRFVEQDKALGLQSAHFGLNISYFKGNMVHAFPLFFDIPGDYPIGCGAFEQLNLAFTGLKKRGIHVLRLYGFGFVAGGL